jgi:deoxyxylulose-5-phosphate synthase
MLDACEAGADRLTADGASVTPWDARVVKPLDPEMLADATTHPCVLTVDEVAVARPGGNPASIVLRDAATDEKRWLRDVLYH